MDWSRAYRHLRATHRDAKKLFDDATISRLQELIASGEATHRGEVRLIVESALPLRKIRRGLGTRQRALDLFGTFRVWDTEENNGVLLYINVADRQFEIVADRAAARAVDATEWQAICSLAQEAFKVGEFERGVGDAIGAIHRALAIAFPSNPHEVRRNELPDRPALL